MEASDTGHGGGTRDMKIKLLRLRELERDIRTFLRHTNEHPKPFIWTKSADQILASIRRFCQYTLEAHGKEWRTSDSGH